MAITDFLKSKQFKSQISTLEAENQELKKMLTPEMKQVMDMNSYIKILQDEINSCKTQINSLTTTIQQRQTELNGLDQQLQMKRSQIISFDDDLLVQDFGLYTPRYNFINAEEYKLRLKETRDNQKLLIKTDQALTGNLNWQVNGSTAQGNKMVRDMQKLLLRAFNSECDETIGKIKYNNFETSLKKINASANAISKLGTMMGISLTTQYINLKAQEAYLALEYQLKKQQEKEAQKEARAQLREAARLQKEIDEQRKKVEKQQLHYQNALLQLIRQMESADESALADLQDKKQELEHELGEIEISLKDIDYREANQRAGYVYVISNIGSFGEGIYKIGMTRRLEPQDRIDELGSASVPFNFDVHTMIFSEDAPALEHALHQAFEDKKVNMVNQRREFFKVSLQEIEAVIKANFDKTVEFVEVPEAEQFRISEKMRNN